jgi:hypothetical protein
MVKVGPDESRIFTQKELSAYMDQLLNYGYLEKVGDKVRLKHSFRELFVRCENFGIKLRPPRPDDDVPTLMSCYLSDLVLREKVFEKSGTKISKRDFDNMFYGYGQIFLALLERQIGGKNLRSSWYNYSKKIGEIPR